jgi:ribose 5-phosphate isomerase B
MTIFIGSDHNGYHLKEKLEGLLKQKGHAVLDAGDEKLDPNDDYPVFAARLVNAMLASRESEPRGILICGSGQGMCIAANRFKGVRAAVLYDRESARTSRNDDDSNVACLPARTLKDKEAELIIETWLSTPFAAADRFKRRIKELDEL